MKKAFLIIFGLFLSLLQPLQAQYKPLDSLYFTLVKYEDKKNKIDTVYVNTLNQLAQNLHKTQPDTALFYAQKALEASEEISFFKGKANAIKQKSINFTNTKNYLNALAHWHKSITAFAQVNDAKEIAICLENIGDIYREQHKNTDALEYYQKSIQNYEAIHDSKNNIPVLNKIAATYFEEEKYNKSEETAQKAILLAKEAKAFGEVTAANITLYKIAKKDKDFVKALEYFELAEQYRDSTALVQKKENSKNIEREKKERDRQIRSMQELLKKNEELRSIENERQELLRAALEKQSKKDGGYASELAKKEKEIQNLHQNQTTLKKDKELQRIEAEREKNARLVLQYHKEAEHLLASARQEKDKHKQDSLHQLAKSKQAEVDVYLRQGQKLKAESNERALEVLREKEAKEFQQKISYITFAGLMGVLCLAYFIFRSRQKQKRAKEEIASQKGEIEQINEELNTTLGAVEIERQKSDKLLLNILPLETAQELKDTGTAKPTRYERITVLFTDFKGFTNISEKLTPEQVIAELNYCFLAFDEICEKYNIEKIKTIGDAYMCAGGLPAANTTNPVDVVSAGLEMQVWMNNWKKDKMAKNEPVWELRLGIHSGEAVAGVIGKNKFAYDIWGDTVNLASRMESSGEVGKVNISGTTYELVKDKFQCVYRGKIEAKNKGEVEMYFVENVS